jgi:hypothetical protein
MTIGERTRGATDVLLWGALFLGAFMFVLSGCAARPVRPDDMSAEAHYKEASREEAAAKEHRRSYEAGLVMPAPGARSIENVGVSDVVTWNPTEWHLSAAAGHVAHAEEHLRAAAELEAFESVECRAVAQKVRGACPVIAGVTRVVSLQNGLRYELKDPGRIADTVALMRCHMAWARARGWPSDSDCPLYVKGIDVRASSDGRAIEIVSADPAVIRTLWERGR